MSDWHDETPEEFDSRYPAPPDEGAAESVVIRVTVEQVAAALHEAIPHWEGHKPESQRHHAIHLEHAAALLAALGASR